MTLHKAATFSTGHLLWRWIIIDWIFFFTFDTEWLIANFEMVPNVIYGMVLESLLTVNV